MAFSKSVNLEHAQTAVPCNICEDEPPGEYYCLECKQTLCPQCEKNHKSIAATKNHNVVQRTQVGDIDATILTCGDHGDNASFHCEKCNIPVCTKCVTGKHRGHELSDLAVMFDREKGALRSEATKMQHELLPKLNQQKKGIIAERRNYESTIKQITNEIEADKQTLHKEVDRILNDQMAKMAGIRHSHLTQYDSCIFEVENKVETVQRRVTKYQNALEENNLPAVLKFSKCKDPLPKMKTEFEMPKPPIYNRCNIREVIDELGKSKVFLSLTVLPVPIIKSKFKSPLDGYPSICIGKHGDVWVCGLESRKMINVNIQGLVIKERKISNRPDSLAMMDCGDIVISPCFKDSKTVFRLLIDDKEQQIYDTSPSNSLGVSITADQKILICIWDGRVLRTNGDGSNVEQIYKGELDSAIQAIESHNGNIYISDRANSAIVIVLKDRTSAVIIKQTDEGKKLGAPIGLVEDKTGNILCSDSDNDCVYIIDQNQRMRKLIGRSQGIKRPRFLAVDNDNNLWITQRDGTILVVTYLDKFD